MRESRNWLINRAKLCRIRLEFDTRGNSNIRVFRDLAGCNEQLARFFSQKEFIAFTDGLLLGRSDLV